MADKVVNQFARNDGYNPSVKCDNPYQEKWIHKDVVKKTGDSEDDFIIEQKPVMIDKINLQKSIDEEAKTTDLKYLLSQLLLQNGPGYAITGEEPELNKRPGFYGDITQIQEVVQNGGEFITPDQIKSGLPEELHDLTAEQLASMSDADILSYIAKVRESKQVAPETTQNSGDLTPEKEG